jgi:hypothetical protein
MAAPKVYKPLHTPKKPPSPIRAAEAVGAMAGGMVDKDDYLWRRLSTGSAGASSGRDLSPMAQDRMLELVFYLWESNALAQWIIETTLDFTVGEPVRIECVNDKVAAVLDAFEDDPVNQLLTRVEGFARDLGLYGELCLPAFVNDVDGHVRLGYLDPFEIKEVLTDPDNALIQTAVRRKPPSGDPHGGELYKIIRGEADRASAVYGQLVGAAPGETEPRTGRAYAGQCFLFQTNRVSNARRGRSDLLSLIDWVDGYDAFLYDAMQAAQQFNSYIWDVTLEGANEKDLTAWLAKNQTVKRGMIRAHNEKVKWAELSPDLKAQDKDTFIRFLRGQILGSKSFPEHWFGSGGDVGLATVAKEMAAPPGRRLARRQQEIKRMIETLCRFQIHAAQRAGRLPEKVPTSSASAADATSSTPLLPADKAYQVVMPEISPKDTAAAVAASVSLSAALTQAVSQGWLRNETAGKIFNHLIAQVGIEVDTALEIPPGAGPRGDALGDYSPANLQRILAQLQRSSNGNGDNINEPKVPAPGGVAG